MYKTIVDSTNKSFKLNLKELFEYRDLFLILTYRDIKVRYAQTFLGLLWSGIQPLTTLLIFTLVFSVAVGVDTESIPYPLYAVCGMAVWTYFSFVLSNSGNSIIGAQEMIKKIYFPRLIIPLSKALVGLIDFGVAFLFIIILMIYYQTTLSLHLIFLPLFILLTVITALAFGIWLSALTIRYRDFQHILPFIVQFGLYITPIGYPSSLIVERLPKWASILFYVNPVAGIVEGYRWCILGTGFPHHYSYISFSMVVIIFISGINYFKRVERIMADIV